MSNLDSLPRPYFTCPAVPRSELRSTTGVAKNGGFNIKNPRLRGIKT
jgi:hypothetical protein